MGLPAADEGRRLQLPSKLLDNLLAGAVAGIAGTLAIYPIDSIKTRLQSGYFSTKSSSNGLLMAQKVLREEGPRGLYRGLAANLIGVTPEKAIKLAVNDAARAHFAAKCQVPIDLLPVQYGMLSGALAGLCQVIATNPMEIVKIQMQLASALPHSTSRPSLLSTVRSLGLGGLYRGAVSTLCRDVPFSIIFFQTFASCKALLATSSKGGTARTEPPTLSLGNTLVAGIMAGALAAYAATPMDVVKTRLQSHLQERKPMWLIYRYNLPLNASLPQHHAHPEGRDIWREDRIAGFFKGGLQRCMIVAPLFAISLVVYELQQHFVNRNG